MVRSVPKPALACLLPVLATTLLAQPGPPPQSIPKFTAKTELVTVPVVVLRHHTAAEQLRLKGTPDEAVTGLSKDDFTIEEDGQPKPLASFEEIRGASPAVKAVAPPAGIYTNEVASEGPVAMVVILLDLINTPYVYQEPTKKRLLEYLQRDFRGDRPTMLVAMHPSGLRVLHDFTSDPQVLVNIVQRLKDNVRHDTALDNEVKTENSDVLTQPIDILQEYAAVEQEFITGRSASSSPYEQQLQRSLLEMTFYELQQLARALSAIRGMKSLVWATGGIILPYSMNSRDAEIVQQYTETLQQLSAAGIAVYPIDTVLDTDNPGFSGVQSRYPGMGTDMLPVKTRLQIVQNFMDIAQRTGGDYCLLRKDPEFCFRKAFDYGSQYYLLSYYTRSPEVARWRKIDVKVRGTDLVVRARSGYFAGIAKGDPVERRKHDIALAMAMPVESRGLPISVRWTAELPAPSPADTAASPGVPQLEQRRPKQPFVLGISADALTVDEADHNHIKLDFVAVALDPAGKVLADLTQQIDLHPSAPELERLRRGGFVYSNALEVPPHTAKVRFIVRDDLGERVGSVSTVPAVGHASP